MDVQIELLQIVSAAAARLGIDIMLIGAFARDYWIRQFHLPDSMRTTFDLDFSCQVAAWQEFQTLFDLLITDYGLKKDPQKSHSLQLRNDISLDLVPCGEIADQNGTIAWPPQYTTKLCVLGYDVAKQDAATAQFGNCRIKVVKPHWLALLKLQSYLDNPLERAKDLQDLVFLVCHYLDCIDYERRIFDADGMDHDLLERDDFDCTSAGAELIRRDCQRFHRPVTERICNSIRNFDSFELLKAMSIAAGNDSVFAEKIIQAFLKEELR